jgi:hypothetical protein
LTIKCIDDNQHNLYPPLKESSAMTTAVRSARTRKPLTLSDTPRMVTIRQAHRFVREASYVALAIPMGGLRQELFDISRRQAKKVLARIAQRHKKVPLADLFGTVIIGDAP